MGKKVDALGSVEDFVAPWETEAGGDAEIEKSKLRRLIYNLKLRAAKAEDDKAEQAEAHADELAELEKERDEAKEEAAKASPEEATKKIVKLEAENKTLKAEKEAREKADEVAELRKDLLEDVDPDYREFVTGETEEEIEASLEKFAKKFPEKMLSFKSDDDDDDPDDEDEDDDFTGRVRPTSRAKNAIDRSREADNENIDFEKMADRITGTGPFG